MFRVAGRYFETADHDEMDAAHKRLNVLARNIASDRLILSVHLVRRAASADDYPAGTFRSAFARRLDEAYRGSVLRQLYRNDMFLSVVRLPPAVAGDRLTSWWSRKRNAQAESPAATRQHLEEICRILQADLAAYGLTRLGVRHEGRVAYSEIGEALSLIVTGQWRRIPMITGRLGRSIHADRVVFGREIVRLYGDGDTRFAAELALREYPAETWPGQFNRLLSVPYFFSMTQSLWLSGEAEVARRPNPQAEPDGCGQRQGAHRRSRGWSMRLISLPRMSSSWAVIT